MKIPLIAINKPITTNKSLNSSSILPGVIRPMSNYDVLRTCTNINLWWLTVGSQNKRVWG